MILYYLISNIIIENLFLLYVKIVLFIFLLIIKLFIKYYLFIADFYDNIYLINLFILFLLSYNFFHLY